MRKRKCSCGFLGRIFDDWKHASSCDENDNTWIVALTQEVEWLQKNGAQSFVEFLCYEDILVDKGAPDQKFIWEALDRFKTRLSGSRWRL